MARRWRLFQFMDFSRRRLQSCSIRSWGEGELRSCLKIVDITPARKIPTRLFRNLIYPGLISGNRRFGQNKRFAVAGVDDSRQLTADSFQFEEGFGEIGGGRVGEVGA